MTPAALEKIKSRNAAVLAAGLLCALALSLVCAPVFAAFRGQDESIAASLLELSKLRAEAATAGIHQRQLSEIRMRMNSSPGSLRANSVALAQSQLQQTMEALASANGGSVRSSQMLPSSKVSGFDAVGIQYDLAVPMSRLRDLVYAVETHTPYLFIEEAQISAGQNWQNQPSGNRDPILDVRWTVRAYRWGGA